MTTTLPPGHPAPRRARERWHLSQGDMARLLGLHAQTVSKVERGVSALPDRAAPYVGLLLLGGPPGWSQRRQLQQTMRTYGSIAALGRLVCWAMAARSLAEAEVEMVATEALKKVLHRAAGTPCALPHPTTARGCDPFAGDRET